MGLCLGDSSDVIGRRVLCSAVQTDIWKHPAFNSGMAVIITAVCVSELSLIYLRWSKHYVMDLQTNLM